MADAVIAPVGAKVTLWCEDPAHDKPVRIVGFTRLADGTTRDNGHVHHHPQVWVHDASEAEMGRGGRLNPDTGLHDWYQDPAPGRVVQRIDDGGLRLRCPLCGHTRPLRWGTLYPILEQLGAHGVARLTLQGLASSLRK